MTLRMDQVLAGLPDVVARYREKLDDLERGVVAAEGAMEGWRHDPEAADARLRAAMADDPSPYALSGGEDPGAAFDAPPFTGATVVAADGSSIDPDRFAAVQCYVISIGEVVLPYHAVGEARLEAKSWVGPHPDDPDPGEGGWAVTLRRDVQELEAAVRLAEGTARGATVMLLDGTLLPWDLDATRVPEFLRTEMLGRTDRALQRLHGLGPGVSAGAYVSASRAGNVVMSLRALAGKPAGPWPPSDAPLFARRLRDGQRSALFLSATSRKDSVESQLTGIQVCFFYLRVGGDIARVELPQWAASPPQLARLHATLVDQCRRCGGYPRALQEAHEQAVISAGDRLQFARQLESEAARQGLTTPGNGKQMSKRRRAL